MMRVVRGAVALLGVVALSSAAEAQTLRMMKSLDAPHYDGARTTWSPTSDIVNMFQDTLVAMDWDGKTAIPYLAKSWTVTPDGKLYTFKLRDDVTLLQRQEVHRRRRRLLLQAADQRRAQGAARLARRQSQGHPRHRSLHGRVRAERAVLRPAAQPHHVHHGDPQQGERRGAGQGLRRQGDRRHRPVVLRLVAAAHRDRAEAPRRLQVGPVAVPEQGPGEVREALDQDRARGFEPRSPP